MMMTVSRKLLEECLASAERALDILGDAIWEDGVYSAKVDLELIRSDLKDVFRAEDLRNGVLTEDEK